MSQTERTTIDVERSTHARLEELKPMPSCSFNDLLDHMADVYEERREGER